MNFTNNAENKLTDFLKRGQNLVVGASTATWDTPPTWHVALLVADHIHSQMLGQAVALNATLWVMTTVGLRLYKCTSPGTLAGVDPGHSGANDQVVTDGTAQLTEQYTAMESGAAFVEVSSSDYARKAILSSLTNFNSTQGDALASTGADGTIENSVVVDYPNAATQAYGNVGAFVLYDAAAGGNIWDYGYMSNAFGIGLGATGIQFAAGQMSFQVDN